MLWKRPCSSDEGQPAAGRRALAELTLAPRLLLFYHHPRYPTSHSRFYSNLSIFSHYTMDALEAPAPVLAAVDTASSRGAFSTVVHAAASVGGILGRPINRAAMGIARPILRFVGVDLSAGGTAGGQAGQRVADARRAATQGAAAGAGAGMVAVPVSSTLLRIVPNRPASDVL